LTKTILYYFETEQDICLWISVKEAYVIYCEIKVWGKEVGNDVQAEGKVGGRLFFVWITVVVVVVHRHDSCRKVCQKLMNNTKLIEEYWKIQSIISPEIPVTVSNLTSGL